MKRSVKASIIAFISIFVFFFPVLAQGNVVRAVLFYSPACPVCQRVITEVLPPLFEKYGGEPEVLYIPPSEAEESVGPSLVGILGESLEILYINTLTEAGNTLYWTAVDHFQIPEENYAVPMLIVGETILIGGNEIPAMFPGIIEQGLAGSGIDWPSVPGLSEAAALMVPVPEDVPTTNTPSPEAPVAENGTESPTEEPTAEVKPTATANNSGIIPPVKELTILDRIKLDPVGNSVSIAVLIGMLIGLAAVVGRIMLPEEEERERNISWIVLLLCGIGIFVAAYLTYVESSGEAAVCGPVGDCNLVQQSKYAKLFGMIPVGGIGLAGYVGIVAMWLASRYLSKPLSDWAKVALLAMALFGTGFSAYLTFLEPFVIGATCAWCLTSSIIITVIMWLVLSPGLAAWLQIRQGRLPPS